MRTLLLGIVLGVVSIGQETVDVPALEWRNLAGKMEVMPLTKTPGDNPVGLFGSWMRPVGLAPLAPLKGKDLVEVGLADRDRFHGRVLGGSELALRVEGAGKNQLEIPIDSLRSLVFAGKRLGLGQLLPAPSGDRLYRLAGKSVDRLDGVLVGFSDQGVAMETTLGERVFPWGEVVALFVEPLEGLGGDDTSVDSTPLAMVDLVCGSRMRGRVRSIQSTHIDLDHGQGVWRISYPWLVEMTILDGRFEFLSWLTPAEVGAVRSPFDPPGSEPLGMVWPHRMDRAVGGGPLLAGGRNWTHGIGVHAPSRLAWDLDGADCFLRLSAGLDDSAKRGSQAGSVVFKVLVDGKEAWNSGVRRGGEVAISPDPIDLKNAKRLELVVTDSGDGPVLDRAAWLAPILIRCDGAQRR